MKMVNAVQLVKKENGNYDVINYHRATNIVDDNGNPERTSYTVAFNFPLDMANDELKRHEARAIRTHGTYLINLDEL